MTRLSFVRIKPSELDAFPNLHTNSVNCKKKRVNKNLTLVMNDSNPIQIKIVTLNVRGLNKSIKRRSIFRWLHKQNAHFYFLQETYSDEKLKDVWEAEWGGKIFCSHGTKHSKGVMILVNPKYDIEVEKLESSFTLYYGLLSSINSKWKITSIQRKRQPGNQNWYDKVENLSNAALHRIIVENKFQPPINEKNILSYGVDDSDIHKIYKWPFLITKNTKLIMLQFKINHSIIYTKDKLKKVNLISNDVCQLCEREKHTIKHMMLKCTYVTLFWNEFFAWWAQITNEKIHLPDSVLLYGPVNLSKPNQVLSLALLVAKYFIYKCNLAEDPLLFSLFKLQFRENILTERYIATKNKTARLFNDKWHCFIIKDFVSEI